MALQAWAGLLIRPSLHCKVRLATPEFHGPELSGLLNQIAWVLGNHFQARISSQQRVTLAAGRRAAGKGRLRAKTSNNTWRHDWPGQKKEG